jgi:hypothetical protein
MEYWSLLSGGAIVTMIWELIPVSVGNHIGICWGPGICGMKILRLGIR